MSKKQTLRVRTRNNIPQRIRAGFTFGATMREYQVDDKQAEAIRNDPCLFIDGESQAEAKSQAANTSFEKSDEQLKAEADKQAAEQAKAEATVAIEQANKAKAEAEAATAEANAAKEEADQSHSRCQRSSSSGRKSQSEKIKPMSYATSEQLIARLAPEHVSLFILEDDSQDTDKMNRLLSDASAQMDAWAGQTPAEAKTPAAYESWCCDLAVYLSMQSSATWDEVTEKRKEDIRKALVKIGSSGQLLESEVTSDGASSTEDDPDGMPYLDTQEARFTSRF